jgi:hypothetical protein
MVGPYSFPVYSTPQREESPLRDAPAKGVELVRQVFLT